METFLNGRVTLHNGDCLAVLPTLAENSIDACVTDPPYHLLSIVKRFGNESEVKQRFAYGCNFKEENGGTGAAMARLSRGFMGKQWDGGDVAFRSETWAAVYRVLKPGAHLVAFGGTRTYHRLACAIEDAGFEIRDTVLWLYGSGFPKSHDVSKAIDKAAGVEFEELPAGGVGFMGPDRPGGYNRTVHQLRRKGEMTDAAREWQGWGTALKPACEMIVMARKPLIGTVAENVLAFGTGAINVDGCRVGVRERPKVTNPKRTSNTYGAIDSPGGKLLPDARWPANVCHDGSDEVVGAFPDAPGQLAAVSGNEPSAKTATVWGTMHRVPGDERAPRNDSGSAARFFYTAKADSDDRLGSKHPTVKPVDLMQYLIRLITPKGGTCLDCFAGTGTTGEAAWREGINAVLIEREKEYQADIRRRMALCLAGPDERTRESIKARGKTDSPGPLFDALNP